MNGNNLSSGVRHALGKIYPACGPGPGHFYASGRRAVVHWGAGPPDDGLFPAGAGYAGDGGLLLIQEFTPDDDRTGPLHPALSSLNMLVETRKGQVYTRADIAAFMRAAGSDEPRVLPLDLPQGCRIHAGVVRHPRQRKGSLCGEAAGRAKSLPEGMTCRKA